MPQEVLVFLKAGKMERSNEFIEQCIYTKESSNRHTEQV
jgi:hypothetical protein